MIKPELIEILLVEDNLDDALLTIRALKKKNLSNNIHHLKDGAEALEYIFEQFNQHSPARNALKPKIILLDLKMPRINGIEVLEKIKSDDRTKAIPVVILTSSNQKTDIEKCYALGANSFVVKPVGFDSFMATVSDLGSYWMLLNSRP